MLIVKAWSAGLCWSVDSYFISSSTLISLISSAMCKKTVKPLKMILHLLQITCSSSTQLATMFPARSHRKVLILGGNLLESRNLLVFISQMIASFQIYSVTPRNYDFSDQMKSHVSVSPSFWKLMLCLITMGSSVWKKSVASSNAPFHRSYPCLPLSVTYSPTDQCVWDSVSWGTQFNISW